MPEFSVTAKNGFVYIADGSGKKIASLLGTEDERYANAYLFAAAGEMREALKQAREHVLDDLRATLECVCVLDKQTLEPIRSTMAKRDAMFVATLDEKLALIDAALAKAEGKQP